MNGEIELIGCFADEERCAHGIEKLHEARLKPDRVFSPVPSEKIAEAMHHKRSIVRAWVLAGGIFGALSGWAITIGTSMEWNLVAGGKPIISIPPFVIISFELMILCGGISAVLSFIYNARLPQLDPMPGYLPRFSGATFGIAMRCKEADGARIEAALKEAGADEVVREELEAA
jgi:Alternative complex III, ActD subunit